METFHSQFYHTDPITTLKVIKYSVVGQYEVTSSLAIALESSFAFIGKIFHSRPISKFSKFFIKIFKFFEILIFAIFEMAQLLRGRRSYNLDLQKREHKRKLVIKALEDRQKEQTRDKLLMDIISAVPRSTRTHIEAVVKKVRRENEHDATRLEDALAHCQNLTVNLSGAKPADLWSESARSVWLDTIEAVTRQSSRWKACPLVLIHPYCGTVEVVTSVCGKHQALSEFSRMRLFAEELKEGLDAVLDDIHPIKDDESGQSLPFDETKEILLDLSQNEGHLSEEEDGALSEDDNTSVDLNDEFEKVNQDWCLDKVQTDGEPPAKSRLISSIDTDMKSPPNVTVSLTSTPPPAMNQSRSSHSSTSSFGSDLFGVETSVKPPKKPSPKLSPKPSPKSSPKPSPKSSKQLPLVPGHHAAAQVSSASLNRFSHDTIQEVAKTQQEEDRPRIRMPSGRQTPPPTSRRTLFPPDRQVIYKPAPWQIAAVPEEEAQEDEEVEQVSSSPRKHAKAPSDLSVAHEAYPNGFTVIPLKNKRKSDAKKTKDKKRPVSSPNLPANKQSRMDRTEVAIEQLQVGQANQNAVLQQLANQMSQFSLHLAMQQK